MIKKKYKVDKMLQIFSFLEIYVGITSSYLSAKTIIHFPKNLLYTFIICTHYTNIIFKTKEHHHLIIIMYQNVLYLLSSELSLNISQMTWFANQHYMYYLFTPIIIMDIISQRKKILKNLNRITFIYLLLIILT